ncbi:MAG: response regulator transcription factor [Pseudonocardiaceae bacterium]
MADGIRVLVADRERMVAEALAVGLRQTGITGDAVTGMDAAWRAATQGRTDLLLADVELIGGDGVGERQPWTRRWTVPLVVLSRSGEIDGLACAAVRAGVRGWVTKDSPMRHLCEVIRGVLRDETHFPPALLTRILSELTAARRQTDAQAQLLATLTAREREVLSCLCGGMTRQAIARRLYLSPCTVRTHVQNLLTKLGVHSSVAAVALAQRAGPPDDHLPGR